MNEMMSYEDINAMLGQAAMLAKNNAESTAVVLKRLNDQENLINGISNSVNFISLEMQNVNDRMFKLEQNEEVTTSQVEEIRSSACKRVYEILGEDEEVHAKYFRTFIRRLYTGARNFAGLGSSIARTKKRDYQRVIDYIEAWIPYGGCAGLKREIDNKAIANVRARELGYEC